MSPNPAMAERIEAARIAKGLTRSQLSAQAGFHVNRYPAVIHGSPKYTARLADLLGVRIEWLTTGAYPPPWYRPGMGMTKTVGAFTDGPPPGAVGDVAGGSAAGTPAAEPLRLLPAVPPQTAAQPVVSTELPVIGTVNERNEWVSPTGSAEDLRPVMIPPHWRAIRVLGVSGYPVVWDRQTVLVDDHLPLRHNRLVVAQTQDGRAYLRRYCVNKDGSAVLASVNVGMDSFMLSSSEPMTLSVVVGVLFTDSVVS